MISRRIWEMHGSGRSTGWAKAAGFVFVLWWTTCVHRTNCMNTRWRRRRRSNASMQRSER